MRYSENPILGFAASVDAAFGLFEHVLGNPEADELLDGTTLAPKSRTESVDTTDSGVIRKDETTFVVRSPEGEPSGLITMEATSRSHIGVERPT